jgi:hypothetical protein
MSDFSDLIARLQSATEGSRELDALIAAATGWVLSGRSDHVDDDKVHDIWRCGEVERYAPPEVTRSVDAALALIERKLPGNFVLVKSIESNPGEIIWNGKIESVNYELRAWANASTPALALCLALLRALPDQQGAV